MVLNELVYSPGAADNSMLINLVQGTFVFVAGQVAPSGDMKVQTRWPPWAFAAPPSSPRSRP